MTSPRLGDTDQERVVLAPPDARLVVHAGPGAGKTFTAARRLTELVLARDDADEPGEARPLAISFSRAAAAAMRAALQREGLASLVEVRTVDSLVLRMLEQLDRSGTDPERATYAERIERLVALLTRQPSHALSQWSHIVVDEAQDIVGDRVAVVELLLRDTPGWTVFADPAQAVYSFREGPCLLDSLAPGGPHEAEIVELRGSYRALTPALAEIRSLGTALRSGSDDGPPAVWRALRSLRVVRIEHLPGPAAGYARSHEHTAILLRDNRQVLDVIERLARVDVPATVASAAAEALIPPWLADIGPPGVDLLPSDELIVPDGLDRDVVVRALTALCGTRRGRLDLGVLADLARDRPASLPAELFQMPGRGLTCSTVHRAKGLEFDRVLIGIDPATEPTGADAAAEARLVYVAMTRARRELFRVDLGRPSVKSYKDRASGRWTDMAFAGRKRYASAVEIRPGDLDVRAPWLERTSGRSLALLGSAVRLEPTSSTTGPPWRALDEHGCVIGHSTAVLDTLLAAVLGRRGPRVLHGAMVAGHQTTALTPDEARPDGVRLVRTPVIRGMVRPIGGD